LIGKPVDVGAFGECVEQSELAGSPQESRAAKRVSDPAATGRFGATRSDK